MSHCSGFGIGNHVRQVTGGGGGGGGEVGGVGGRAGGAWEERS